MTVPQLAPVKAAVVAAFTTALTDVHEHATPPDVDPTRPYVVIQWPPGGGQAGSAVNASQRWELVCRTVCVGISPDPSAEPHQAAHDAAAWMADQVRAFILAQPVFTASDGSIVSGVSLLAAGGVDQVGNVANITDDYLLRVTAPC